MHKVRIRMMALDAAMQAKDGTLEVVRDTHDVGIGLVVGRKADPLDDDADRIIYHIAVLEGRFDGHRNDSGELWVNESEIQTIGPVPGDLLSAAQALLAARHDDMVTAEEWDGLEHAVANAAGDADPA